MKPHTCGCTPQQPGVECEQGQKLFAAIDQTFQALVNLPITARDERWIAYTLARFAYLDHLHGWQEGDAKVRREGGIWIVYARLCGQWVFWFGTRDEAILRAWLADRGYQQYVQIKHGESRIHLLGYYRRQTTDGPYVEGRITSPAENVSISQEQDTASGFRLPSQLDLKTQVTIRVALLVAQFSRPLTVTDRLYVERRAKNVLLSHGIQIGPSDEKTIAELIDEAIQQKESMNNLSARSTRPL